MGREGDGKGGFAMGWDGMGRDGMGWQGTMECNWFGLARGGRGGRRRRRREKLDSISCCLPLHCILFPFEGQIISIFPAGACTYTPSSHLETQTSNAHPSDSCGLYTLCSLQKLLATTPRYPCGIRTTSPIPIPIPNLHSGPSLPRTTSIHLSVGPFVAKASLWLWLLVVGGEGEGGPTP